MKKLRGTFTIAASAMLLYAAPLAAKSQAPEDAGPSLLCKVTDVIPVAPQLLENGKRYQVVMKLPFLLSWTSNSSIKQMLEPYDLANVSVEGSGSTRSVFGTYTGPDKCMLDELMDSGVLTKLNGLGVTIPKIKELSGAPA